MQREQVELAAPGLGRPGTLIRYGPVAICQSGSYDPTQWCAWGERGDAAYFNNPTDYVQHLDGDHLRWLRHRVFLLLTVGQGAWETGLTGSLPSARHLAHLLHSKQIPCELDEWVTTRRTTGRGGSGRSPTTCRGSADVVGCGTWLTPAGT